MIKNSLKKLIKLLFDRRPRKNICLNFVQNKLLLNGRCALITGGTSGIGLAIAKAFIQSGAAVVITGRNQEKLEKVVSILRTENGVAKVFGVVLDNTNVLSFSAVLDRVLSQVKLSNISEIDILVNNAGVNFKGMPNATEDEYDMVLDTNLRGTFFLSQMFGKYWVSQGIEGNILNIASASSLRPADSAYTISKWGLRGLTLGLAKSLSKNGITVNGIAPGPTATPMMIKGANDDMNLDRIPLGRYIMPEEIAQMAVILVSDLGKSILGDIVYMTGGAGNLTYDDVKYSF